MHDNILPVDAATWSQTNFDQYFIRKAVEISNETDDPKIEVSIASAVGAVITKNNVSIAKSANRLPPVLRGKYEFDRIDSPDRYVFIEHAERCAIFDAARAGASVLGGTIYCTRFPCSDCARAIIYSGLIRIVVAKGFSSEGAWIDSQRAALKLFRTSELTIRYISPDVQGEHERR